MLIDSHVHLDDSRYDSDREEIIKNLGKNLELIINIGADLKSSVASVKLAEENERIYAAVGVHPHSAKDLNEASLEVLKALAKRERVVAIGEIGLDYYYDNSPRDTQRYWFEKQLDLAKELDLPVVIHSRDATEDTYKIIKNAQDGSLRGVLHCFSGSPEVARSYIDLGFYISLAGPVTFKNARVPKEVAKSVDLDRLLIETDSPYLTPHPFRGKRNSPEYVAYVGEEIARLRDMDPKDLIKITNENTKKLFRI